MYETLKTKQKNYTSWTQAYAVQYTRLALTNAFCYKAQEMTILVSQESFTGFT